MNIIIIIKTGMSLMVFSFFFSFNRADENPFWGDGTERFEVQEIFSDESLPNVVVAKDGSVLAVWGWGNFRVRRSEDGEKHGIPVHRFRLMVPEKQPWKSFPMARFIIIQDVICRPMA